MPQEAVQLEFEPPRELPPPIEMEAAARLAGQAQRLCYINLAGWWKSVKSDGHHRVRRDAGCGYEGAHGHNQREASPLNSIRNSCDFDGANRAIAMPIDDRKAAAVNVALRCSKQMR